MAFCTIDFPGKSIGRYQAMHVILHDGDGTFPVLYLLHGLSDDYTIWQRRSSIERYVMGLPLIVVMPDGGRSFYCNHPEIDCGNYEDYIVKDVVGFVDRTFHTIADRRGRAIAGASMGGFGATMLAMKHPDVFSVACSHSGALGFAHQRRKGEQLRETVKAIDALGKPLPGSQYDCYKLAAKVAKGPQKVAYRMDCGDKDILIADNRAFHAHLDKIGYQHEYAEHPHGHHNWEYFDLRVRDTVEFVMGTIKTK